MAPRAVWPNIATAHPDVISRVIAGGPPALLIAIKLLSGILTHRDTPASSAARFPEPGPAYAGSLDATGEPGLASRPASPAPPRHAGDNGGGSTSQPRSLSGTTVRRPSPAQPAAPPIIRPGLDPRVAQLLPAAHAVMQDLERNGRTCTRDVLAACLRQQGYQIRNSRLTLLLRTLRDDPGHHGPWQAPAA